MTAPWMQTRSGARYDLLNPDPTTIVLDDVAHALAHIGRFTGHARTLYTVAQHSVLGSLVLRDEGHDAGVQRAFLMHDAHEAFVGDVASPIKAAIRSLFEDILDEIPNPDGDDDKDEDSEWIHYPTDPWTLLERKHMLAIASRFGTPREMPASVKRMDLRMLMTEARDLMTPPPDPWGISAEPVGSLRIGRCWSPAEAKGYFLDACVRLGVM